MNFSALSAGQRLTVLLELLGGPRYAAQMRTAAGATTTLGRTTRATGYEMTVASRRTFLMNQAMYTLRRYSFFATTALIGASAAVIKLGYNYLSAMQTARVALRPVIKDSDTLNSYLNRLFTISKYSPFVITDLAVAFRQMFAGLNPAGISAPTILRTIQSLTDLMSYTGKTGPGALQRTALALQHMAFAGRLTGYAVNQLSKDGVPIMPILNKYLGITSDQLHNISKMGIPAAKVLGLINRYARETPAVRGAALRISLRTLPGLLQVMRDSISQLSGAFIGSSYKGFQGFLYNIAKPGGPLDRISTIGTKQGGTAALIALSRSLFGSAGLGRGFLLLLSIVKNIAGVFAHVLIPAFVIALHSLIIFYPALRIVNSLLGFMAKHGKVLRWVFAALATEFVISHFAMIGAAIGMRLLGVATFGTLPALKGLLRGIKLLREVELTGAITRLRQFATATTYAGYKNGTWGNKVYRNNTVLAIFTRRIIALINWLKKLRAAMVSAGFLSSLGPIAAAGGIVGGAAALSAGFAYYMGQRDPQRKSDINLGTVGSAKYFGRKGRVYVQTRGASVPLSLTSPLPSQVAGTMANDTVIHTHVHIDRKQVAEAVNRVNQDKRARR